MKICVIIPTFNVEDSIIQLITDVKSLNYDIIIIDDGSSDKTAARAHDMGVHVIALEKNYGKGFALKQGFRYALDNHYDAVITMDGDGQHIPADIPILVEAAPMASIIIGARIIDRCKMPFIIHCSNTITSWLISKLCRVNIKDTQSGFRLIHRSVLENCLLQSNHYEIESELLIKAIRLGHTVHEVHIHTKYNCLNPRPTIMRDIWQLVRLLLHLITK